MEIQHVLVLSTAHLRKETAIMFSSGEAPCGVIVDNLQYGYLMYADLDPHADTDTDTDDAPELIAIIALAKAHDCSHVRFDSYGPIVPELPTFEW